MSSPFAYHFNLSLKQSPTSEKGKEEMQNVPYALVIDSLMYVMACIWPDIIDVAGVLSRFLSNPGKEHWAARKWILRDFKSTS